MAKERELAEQIIKVFGGQENIAAASFCMTRLRLTAVDKAQVDTNELKKIEIDTNTEAVTEWLQSIDERLKSINSNLAIIKWAVLIYLVYLIIGITGVMF